MDAVTREHARSLTVRAEKVKEAIEAVRVARSEEAACAEDGDERGRARARRELADGSKQTAGMFDSQLNVQCYFGKASDGKIRCLPVPSSSTVTSPASGYFADASCLQALGYSIGACAQTPTVVSLSATDTSTCTTTTTNYQAGAQFTGPLYQLSSSTCTAIGAAYQSTLVSDGWKFYALGSQIQPPDPSQYVEATLQTEP